MDSYLGFIPVNYTKVGLIALLQGFIDNGAAGLTYSQRAQFADYVQRVAEGLCGKADCDDVSRIRGVCTEAPDAD